LQHCTCGQLLDLAAALESGDHATAVRLAQQLLSAGAQARAGEQLRMAADAMLPLPRSASSVAAHLDCVVLTGATGFFGPFLLSSLLTQTKLPILVIARGHDDAHARQRVEVALRRAEPAAMGDRFASRVRVWSGDLAAPGLGLADAHRHELIARHCAIYHNAAQVDYVRTYDALRSVNVLGTQALLQLAMVGAPKSLHHVSSTFIFGWTRKGVLYENDDNGEMVGLDFGYSQSKWVAEQLVRRAGQAGLAVTIYRPSLISVARSLYGDTHDVAARLLAFMIRYGVAVDTPNQLSLLPVDTLAQNLVAISLRPEAVGETYHLTADRYHSMTELTRQISHDFGYSFDELDIPCFISRLNDLAHPDDPVFPLLDFFNRAAPHIAAMSLKRYDNRCYRNARAAASGALQDPTLAETARRLVLFLRNNRWIALSGGLETD
jgi:thioester reductase-like protein